MTHYTKGTPSQDWTLMTTLAERRALRATAPRRPLAGFSLQA